MDAPTGDRRRRHSIPSGDVALCSLPPYSTQPWLSMGVVLHYAMLAGAGLRARVVRPLDPPFRVPKGVLESSLLTFTRDPPMEQRMSAMEREYAESRAFFDSIVDELLVGGERVLGLCVYRNNVDFTLQIARLVKQRRAGTMVVIGGPEAVEEPTSLRLPWVDAVVGADAEIVFVPLIEALLAGEPDRAVGLPNVWLNPSLGAKGRVLARSVPLSQPEYPAIDYAPLMPLIVGDEEATMPLLLNWGCPYRCTFCSNKNIYSRFTQGSVERLLGEMDVIMGEWSRLHDGAPPGITLQLSDATTNALGPQFEELLRGVATRRTRWSKRPLIRGQSLFDTRITEERAHLMKEGCFGSTFFGLESASDRLRRELRKPASIAQVAEAMETYHRAGAGGLHFAVPVGIPGETDEDFEDTCRFVEWALGLKGTIASITVLPYAFFLTAQDPGVYEVNRGERRGVLWQTDAPGGDPAVRARRFMRLFELIDRRVPVDSPFPPYLFLKESLPEQEHARAEAFMDRFGRAFDQFNPVHKPPPQTLDPAFANLCARARAAFEASQPLSPWAIDSFGWSVAGTTTRGMAVVFRGAEARRFALLLEPMNASRPSFARSRDFNLSYLKEWKGMRCDFDRDIMAWCASTIARSESA